ncbi:hypothetical protein [Prevotella melaninogenica]|uniref:hypothetical protein n=1 Tax=Prevotella melaninogenica TaxID=28132 RepID=UPI001BA83E45|nr:hypothetical protein [Prevotella melaninogenica]QUB64900.1 hypothetical protein J5A57_04850 [Prevotella melaninogenica]
MEDKEIKYYVYSMLILIGLLALTALCLTSCSHRTYIPLQSVRTDTIYMSRKDSVHIKDSLIIRQVINIRDSVAIHDSIVIIKDDQGHIKEKLIVRYRDRWHATQDNLTLLRLIDRYKASNDSLRATKTEYKEVPIPVEKKLSRWQKFKMDVGGWAIGAMSTFLLAIVGYIVVWLLKKYRKI